MIIPTGSSIGVFGGGQLGKMFSQAATRYGYKVHIYAPEDSPVAASSAHSHTRASYEDSEALKKFAHSVAIATYEFENVPAIVGAAFEDGKVQLHPSGAVLYTAQNRTREKNFFKTCAIGPVPFAKIHTDLDIAIAKEKLSFPAILKTAESGYDGKGQIEVRSAEELERCWQTLKKSSSVLEQKIALEKEVSVVVARNRSGHTVTIGPIENIHKNHILFTSTYPATVSETLKEKLITTTKDIASKLDAVGVLCVEYFVDKDENVYANEMAPRPHNSGHFSIEALSHSQFDLHVRALTGMPLVEPVMQAESATMVNLLGELWLNAPPANFSEVNRTPGAYLHLYGKKEPQPGRKMGHFTYVGQNSLATAQKLLQSLYPISI